MKEIIKKGIIFGLSSVLTMIIAGLAYAATVGIVTTGDTLTADIWNAMAGNYDYSLNEIDTGKKWIDGKPIYRKIISVGAVTGNKLIDHNILDINDIAMISYSFYNGTLWLSSSSSYLFDSSYDSRILVNNTQVDIRRGTLTTNISRGYVILEYTKTTD